MTLSILYIGEFNELREENSKLIRKRMGKKERKGRKKEKRKKKLEKTWRNL